MRTKLTLAGIAAGALMAAGLSISTPAYASSLPSDCTFSVSGESLALTCTNRPAGQVWNLEIGCRIEMGPFVPESGNEVTGDGVSRIAYCYKIASSPSFVVDS